MTSTQPTIIDELAQLLSEAAVEIANLDDERNPVYRRLRAIEGRIERLRRAIRFIERSRNELTAISWRNAPDMIPEHTGKAQACVELALEDLGVIAPAESEAASAR
jgi:chromosome segregation ATPase